MGAPADAAPPVSVRFSAGPGVEMDVEGAAYGLAIAPHQSGRLAVCAMGTDQQVLLMALAVFDYCRSCDLEQALLIALARRVGAEQSELVTEHMYDAPPTQEV